MESKLNFTPSPNKNGDYYPPKHKWKLIPTIFPELENTNAFLKDLLECKTSLKKIITVSQKYNITDFEHIKQLYNKLFCTAKGCKQKAQNKVDVVCCSCDSSQSFDKKLNNQKETDGIKLLLSLLGPNFPYNIIKNCEFAPADLLVNKKGTKISYDLNAEYKGIQIKTSSVFNKSRKFVKFSQTNNYNDMLIIGINVDNKRFWFFNGNDIKVTLIEIPLSKNTKSKYKKNEIKKEDIRDELLKWLDNNERLPYKTYEYLSKPKQKEQLKEFYTFRNFIENIDQNIEWNYPKIECTAIDIIYQNEWGNVQHKNAHIGKRCRGLRVMCNRKNCGRINSKKRIKIPYNIKDGIDNFIIFATRFAGNIKSVERCDVVGYWILPIKILVEKGIVANEHQEGKKRLYVYR